MYKVMMIDDELDILYGAQLIIDWSAEGFELSKLCNDSQDALDTLRREPVDLIITDIRMPKIDGLTLVTVAQKEFPQTKVIVLSGYDDFQYAKTAFKAGVMDYMLKPLDATELTTALRNVRDALDQERNLQPQKSVQSNSTKVIGEHQLFHCLLTGFNTTLIDENAHLVDQLEIIQYRMLIGRSTISRFPGDDEENSNHISKTLFMMLNNSVHVRFHMLFHEVAVFLLEQEPDLQKKIDQVWHELQNTQLKCSVLLSPVLDNLRSLNNTYQKMQSYLEHSIFFGSGAALHLYRNVHQRDRMTMEWPMDQYRTKLRRVLMSQDELSLEKYLYSLVAELRGQKEQLSVEQGRMFWRLFSTIFLDTLKNVFHISQDSADEFSYGSALIKYFLSMEEIANHLLFLAQTALTANQIGVSSNVGTTISQICFYLQVHAYEDISLGQIAEMFYLNPSYLSRMFHDKMNMSFWSYVVDLRLEKAKKLLSNTNDSMKAIAHACGFQSEKSFYSSFKKNVGCTPGSFRAEAHKTHK